MRIQNPFYIIILLFMYNTGDGSALLMHGNSNGSYPIHPVAGQDTDVADIKQMVLNLTAEMGYLRRQTDIIPTLKQNLTALGEEKKILQNRVIFLEIELNKLNASKPPSNDELMAYLRSTKQICAANEKFHKNLTVRLNEADNKNAINEKQNKNLTQRLNEIHDVLIANEEYDKNLTQQLTDSMNNVHDIKVQLRYTSLSLMDVHSKTDRLNTTLTRNLDDQIRGVYGQITNITKKVAFTAGVTSSSSSWHSGPLVFDRIVYNVGGGYDSRTGVFTSPVDGHFVFFLNVQADSSDLMYTYLVLNGSSKVTTMAYGSDDSYDAGPNLVVLRLQRGDRVWVKLYSGLGYYTSGDAPVTTFSGFLI